MLKFQPFVMMLVLVALFILWFPFHNEEPAIEPGQKETPVSAVYESTIANVVYP